MTDATNREEILFEQALRLASPDERESYLRVSCGKDAALRERLLRLLGAHDRAGRFLEGQSEPYFSPACPAPDTRGTLALDRVTEQPGAIIGRYKLLEKLGEGGFGVVYMAEQREPVKRRVALKIIKAGMDTREVVARFEAERQALAMMDHPNIAKVLDGGATPAAEEGSEARGEGRGGRDEGRDASYQKLASNPSPLTPSSARPYFVMELVRGIKLTDYCEQNHLNLSERLKLFMQVCQAVQHAHQKGIIHRDLKPSNILVTLHDGVPVPKVIDFGIAKATERKLTDKTLFTQFAQFIGTPAYMSPEQTAMTSLDIDTRSDIYSLGVLLYELLTGTTPFDSRKLLEAGFDEMRRIIRETEPEKPSTRLSTLTRNRNLTPHSPSPPRGGEGARRAGEGANSQVQPQVPPHPNPLPQKGEGVEISETDSRSSLATRHSSLATDLDWIVMKCLEKDRNRRYETANGLASDIRRHLGNEPVLARPPSAIYKLRKAVRRNKVAFTAVGAVVAALVLGLGMSLWSLRRTQAAEREQSRLRQEAESARANAEASEKAAQTEAAKSEQVARFLTDMLDGVGPSVALGRDTALLREILEKTERRISEDLGDQPEVEVQLRNTLGDVYYQLGDYPKAEAMANQALALRHRLDGGEHPEAARSLRLMGNILYMRGEYDRAEALHLEALAMRRRLLGDEHKDVAMSLYDLGVVLFWKNDRTGAEDWYNQALETARKLRGEPRTLAFTLGGVAFIRGELDDHAEAERLRREQLEIQRQEVGQDHPDIVWSWHGLAVALANQDKWEEAESLWREAVALIRKLWGEDHPIQVDTLQKLARALLERGDFTGAESILREALAILRQTPDNDGEIADILTDLMMVAFERWQMAEAETYAREALAIRLRLQSLDHGELLPSHQFAFLRRVNRLRLHGPEKGDLSIPLSGLAAALNSQGRLAEAGDIFRDMLAVLRNTVDADHPELARTLLFLSGVLTESGADPVEGERYAREALAILQKLHGPDHAGVAAAMHIVALALRNQGRLAEAGDMYRDILAMRDRIGDTQSDFWRMALDGLMTVLSEQGKSDEIEQWIGDTLKTATDPSLRASLLDRRGVLRARSGRWNDAALDFAQAVELEPDNHVYHHNLAPLLVRSSDLDGYRRQCQRAVAQFRETQDPNVAERMAKDCLILPDSGVDLDVVAAWTDLAVTVGKDSGDLPWFQHAKGLAEYRRGQFEQAVEWSRKALGQSDWHSGQTGGALERMIAWAQQALTLTHSSNDLRDLQATAVLAMARHRLGQETEARAALDEAVALEAKLPRLDSGDIGEGWLDWIIAHTLLHEARSLIEGDPTLDFPKTLSTPEARP